MTNRPDLLGHTIDGKYRLRSVLGQGGMGTVYEAENLQLGRVVAVKVLHPAQAKKSVAVKRFHQEARAAGRIGHPNICEVYDLGTLEGGAPYLVMERLSGITLADRIAREGGLPFEDCIDVVQQVLSGLLAAHAQGIVHRDIKPENVFITRPAGCAPVAKILDFGVSKMLRSEGGIEDIDLTRTGMVMGTPFYMSPEQARGDRNLDPRVDIWACGVLLYEALTGRRPFVAGNYNALLLQILTTTPRPARELRPDLPRGFDPILDRALARARDQRYPSAEAFQRDLIALRAPRASDPPPAARSAPSQPAQAEAPDSYDYDPSGTHIALDLVGSGELDAEGPPPETATGFEDAPTEVVANWDDPTTRKPHESVAAMRAAIKSKSKLPARPPAVNDDTVKIEGDLEEHFARMHPEAQEDPRIPRPRRPR